MKENADKHRALDTAEIEKNLRESAEQVFRLKFQMSMGQMDPLKKYRALRKDRARMLTVLRERELNLQPAEAKQPAEAAPAAVESKPAKKKAAAVKSKPAPKVKTAAKPKAAAKAKAEKAPAKKAAAKKTAPKKSKAKGKG